MKKLTSLVAASAVALVFSACSSSNDAVEFSSTPLSADSTKSYIQETAIEAVNLFNANDQADLTDFAKKFVKKYSDYDLNLPFSKRVIAKMQDLAEASEKKKVETMYLDILAMYTDQFGTYAANDTKKCFEKKGDFSGFKLNFDLDGKQGSFCISVPDTLDKWSLEYLEDASGIKFPKKVYATITYGNKTLVNAALESDINLKGGSLNIYRSMTAANLQMEGTTTGSNTLLKDEESIKINGKDLFGVNLSLTGKDMFAVDSLFKTFIEVQSTKVFPGKYFHKLNATININDRLTLNAEIDTLLKTVSGMTGIIKRYPSAASADSAINSIQKNFGANLYIKNNTAEQARITFYKKIAADNKWTIVPGILINEDNTIYSLEDFFSGEDFTKLMEALQDKAKEYKEVIQSIMESESPQKD